MEDVECAEGSEDWGVEETKCFMQRVQCIGVCSVQRVGVHRMWRVGMWRVLRVWKLQRVKVWRVWRVGFGGCGGLG